MHSFTWLISQSKLNNIYQYETEAFGILCVFSVSHILVRAFMHFMTNEVERGEKRNIPVAEISSICPARTDCSLALPCRGAVNLPSLPASPVPPSLLYGVLSFFCRPDSVTLTQAFFWLCRLLPTSLVKTYDHPSWIKQLDTARAGNGSISAGDMLIKLATYYQNETLREAATMFVRSNWMHFSQLSARGAWEIRPCSLFCIFQSSPGRM